MSEASCYQVRLFLDREDAERLSAVLSELYWPAPDAVGIFEADGGRWQLDAYFLDRPEERDIRNFLAAHGLGDTFFLVSSVADTDWVALTQSRLHPVRAGKFLIHGSHDRETVARNRWSIEIDAAQAFGTAHHGSTQGCLEMLVILGKEERFANCLDLGTGTGILAIVAARLWRARVLASDIDPVATQTAEANVRANGVGRYVTTITATGLAHREIRRRAPYDLLTANILARPLMTLASSAARVTTSGSLVVLSGIIRAQSARVAAAYRAAGFTRHREIAVGDWVTLSLRRS